MRQEERGTSPDEPAACQSASDMLKQVSEEIAQFEAKKLPELKAELDAFVKKQEELVKAYKESYPAFREKWCLQQQQVQQLYSALKCSFPPPSKDWKKIVEECICKRLHELNCLAKRIEKRKRCCSGPLERARDEARSGLDAAKADLDVLKSLGGRIQALLDDDAALIKEINTLMSGSDHAVVLWLFWFRLLPNHTKLAPADLQEDCKKLGDGETPEKLCGTVYGQPCKEEPGGCTPPEDEDADYPHDGQRPLPWLMPPRDYGTALDCAWQTYRESKDAWAQAAMEYAASPDDIEALKKKLEEDKKAVEGRIKECLKNAKPGDDCCEEPDDEGGAKQTSA